MSATNDQRPSQAERMARMAAEQGLKKLVASIGGGTLLLILLFIVLMAALVSFLGGGMPGITGGPPVGTAQSRPVEWLGYPALAQAGLPNAVILAVMAHESGGRIFATNYNCTGGAAAARRCSRTYPGTHTLSEDAGLLQINSGGWPVPQKAAKWQALRMAQDPFDPALNIPAGVQQLTADMGKYHDLKYALEAYNAGSGGPHSTDASYPAAVQGYLTTYEAGPTIAVWATADWTHGQWTVMAYQRVWLVVVAAGPYGPHFSVPWKPLPPKCTTTKSKKTGRTTTTCKPQKPKSLKGRDLVQPASVTADGQPMTLDPKGAPVWPGAEVWAVQVTGPGGYGIVATWPGGHTATANITLTQPTP